MISKELLSEMLNKNIVCIYGIEKNLIKYKYKFIEDEYVVDFINIYEATNKCKEWIFDNYKVYLSSGLGEDSSVVKFWVCDFKIDNEFKSFYADTEVEAIFEACEWVLKEIKK